MPITTMVAIVFPSEKDSNTGISILPEIQLAMAPIIPNKKSK
ncbi:hypothetical protein [uncultured Flavobacterium sp.]|nr:hypothetical protein [uncultured Flavobacterium sp.]